MCSEKRRWVIFYILNILKPHISVVQKIINCLSRENENQGFLQNMDFDCKPRVKVIILMNT
jgi:hypothetical protein